MKYFLILFSFIVFLTSCGPDKKEPIRKRKTEKTSTSNSDNSSSSNESKLEVKTSETSMTKAQLDKANSIIASVSKDEIEELDGKKIFKIHCALCHGFKGDMMVNGAKDLTKSKVDLTNAVAQVYHGKGLMQPYKGILSDAEIVSVSKYAESLRK